VVHSSDDSDGSEGSDVLDILGLDDSTERVYRELVQSGPSSVETLALRLGLPRESVAGAVEVLEAKSLANRNPVGLVQTAPPQLALGALLTAQRHALGQAELTAAALNEAYHAASAQNAHELVQVVVGADQVRQRLEYLQLNAESELLALVQAQVEIPETCEDDAESVAVERGVSYRVVVERAGLNGPQTAKDAAPTTEQIRVVETVPTKMIIADRCTVMLPLSLPGSEQGADDGPMALISRAPGLVNAMLGLFESVWQRALPVRKNGDETLVVDEPGLSLPTPLDLRILSLLLVGATDAAIAKQLGLGLRTVQRRVAHMMELAEVSTRLQLGWQAHDRGWLK
jgi:sugar-specific transcriptional regulator TrmB